MLAITTLLTVFFPNLGVTILAGRRYTQTVEKSYHISKAVLEIPVDGKVSGKRVQLMLEHNKTHYLLCNLDNEKTIQVDLDLIFTEGEEVTFYLNGEGTVHLSGYVLEFGDDFDEDDDELYDEESEDEEVENPSAKQVASKKGGDEDITNQNSKRVKTEEANSGFVSKKAKVNGSMKEEEDDDDDDSDDALGNLDEEFDSADEEDDEEMDDEEDDEESDEEENGKNIFI